MLIDPMSVELVDFQIYLTDSGLLQGKFPLERQKLITSPYLICAVSNHGVFLGLQTIHILEGQHIELYSGLLRDLTDSRSPFDSESNFSNIPEFILEFKRDEIRLNDFSSLKGYEDNAESPFYNLKYIDQKGHWNRIRIPSASNIFAIENYSKESFWLTNHSQSQKEYRISWNGHDLIRFDIEATDSLEIEWESFSIGYLSIHDADTIHIITNRPSIQRLNRSTQVVPFGGEISIPIPEVMNPGFDKQNFLIHAVVSTQPYTGFETPEIPLVRFSDSSMVFTQVGVRSVTTPRKKPDFLGIILMDSTSQIPFFTSESEGIELTSDLVYSLSRGKGRVRLATMDKDLEVIVHYPEMMHIMKGLNGWLRSIIKDLMWSTIDFSTQQTTLNFEDFELLDLEEIIITEEVDESLEAEITFNPFSIHWINTDYLCHLGFVLNCPHHFPLIGNHPLARSNKLALHVFLKTKKGVEFLRALKNSRASVSNQIYSNTGEKIFVSGLSGIPVSHAQTFRQGYLNYSSSVYKWSPEPYLKNMAPVKYFNDNHFEDLKEELVLEVEERKGLWSEYKPNQPLVLRSVYSRGSYHLNITYLDLNTRLSSTVSIPFEVRLVIKCEQATFQR
jgi:hypothetical protein